MVRIPYIVFFFFFITMGYAQKNDQPIFSLNAHRSMFLGNWVKVNGLRLGLLHRKKLGFGLGAFSTAFVRLEDAKIGEDFFFSKVRFVYANTFVSYRFVNTKKWGVNLENALGSGRARVVFSEVNNLYSIEERSEYIPIVNSGLLIEYKLFDFLSFSAGGGYKVAFSNQKIGGVKVSESLNSWYYLFKLNLYFSALKKRFDL